jgi:hypothetical protein
MSSDLRRAQANCLLSVTPANDETYPKKSCWSTMQIAALTEHQHCCQIFGVPWNETAASHGMLRTRNVRNWVSGLPENHQCHQAVKMPRQMAEDGPWVGMEGGMAEGDEGRREKLGARTMYFGGVRRERRWEGLGRSGKVWKGLGRARWEKGRGK